MSVVDTLGMISERGKNRKGKRSVLEWGLGWPDPYRPSEPLSPQIGER